MEKNKYVLIKKLNNFPYRARERNDDYLFMLAAIFDDARYFVDTLHERLLDSHSKGVTGNLCRVVKVEDNKVHISFEFDDVENGADFIEIDRNVLIGLIEKWKKIIVNVPPEIYIYQKGDGPIEIADKLPDGFLVQK